MQLENEDSDDTGEKGTDDFRDAELEKLLAKHTGVFDDAAMGANHEEEAARHDASYMKKIRWNFFAKMSRRKW